MSSPIRLLPVLLVLAVVAPANAADAAPLGRLFFTPERRAALERQRAFNIQEAQTLQGSSMSLDGVVYRSGGTSTVLCSSTTIKLTIIIIIIIITGQ